MPLEPEGLRAFRPGRAPRGPSGPRAPSGRRIWAWARRIGVGFGVLLLLLIGAVALLLQSLDQPWCRRRIQALAQSAAGVVVDYRSVHVNPFAGATIDDLVVRSPAEVAGFAPDLLRVEHVAARWSLGSLLFGKGPKLSDLAIHGLVLNVVMDEHGRTTFDAFPPSPPSPPTPLSHLGATIFAGAPPVGRVAIDGVTLTLIRTEGGHALDRFDLRGLGAALALTAAKGRASWQLHGELGREVGPLDLELTRTQSDAELAAARAHFWFSADAGSTAIAVALDLRMLDQSFATPVSADHWLHVEGGAQFDAAGQRVLVSVDRAEAGDRAVSARAKAELADRGAFFVHDADVDLDAARWLHWLPASLVPVTAGTARLRAHVENLAVDSPFRLSPGSKAVVEADLADVDLRGPPGPLHVDRAGLSIHAGADDAALAVQGRLDVGQAAWGAGDGSIVANDVGLDLDGKESPDGAIAGHAGLKFARFAQGHAIEAATGTVGVDVQGLAIDTKNPLGSRGGIRVAVACDGLEVREGAVQSRLQGLSVHAETDLHGGAPYAIQIDAVAARVRVKNKAGADLADAKVHVSLHAHDVTPDLAHPEASRGTADISLALGNVEASLAATKEPAAVDFEVRAGAPTLGQLKPFLPAALVKEAPWDRMGLTVHSKGRVANLGGAWPEITHATEVDLAQPAFRNVSAQSVALTLASHGTALVHQADLDLRAKGLSLGSGEAKDDHVSLSASVDRQKASLQFKLATEGRAASHLTGSLAFEPSRRALLYGIDGNAGNLAAVAPLVAGVRGLEGFDVSALGIEISAHGALLGVLRSVARDGTAVLEPNPARTAAVEGKADLRLTRFRWAKGDVAILTPAVTWHGDMGVASGRRTLESHIDTGTLHLDLGTRDVDLNGIEDEAKIAVAGDLADPEIELTQRVAVKAVAQTVVPFYPLGDLSFAVSAERGSDGMIHVADLRVANGLGGTALEANGNIDLGEGRRTLSVSTSLTQDLPNLSTIPERFQGRGRVGVEAGVTSPDLIHYRVRATVKEDDVNITSRRYGLEVQTMNGQVPISVAIEVGPHGVALTRSEKQSPYSMLRFADQHPLLARSGFLSIASIKTPFVTIAPLVGNLEIEQNLFSLRQFEMGVRGGRITGQCGLDWDGPRSTLEVHVRASGVQSSHGEPFDGNIAVALSAADRTIEGRAEILRIGPRHLLDLLDLQDPLHVDPAMNRVRWALSFGYPDNLRLTFDHGFASAHLELGGLARLISISDIRGIPMGPIIDKMLAPVLDGPDAKETP
jgi:translocation and assembly module TamB